MKHFITRFAETARANWDSPALCDYEGASYRYSDVAGHIARLHIVFDKLGVQPGDKIAICAKNTAHWAITYFATTSYRAVAVPILNGFSADMLQNLVGHSDSVVLFTEKHVWDEMDSTAMPHLLAAIDIDTFQAVYAAQGEAADVTGDIDALFAAKYPDGLTPELVQYPTGSDDDLITISYTSGTTSSPKGIMLSVRNISSNITFGVKRIKCPKGSNMVSMLPLAHLYGLAFEFIYPVSSGCCVYFLGKMPTPSILMRAFADVHPYMLITVPLVVEKIFRSKVVPVLERPLMRVLTSIPVVKNVIYGSIRKKLLQAFGGSMEHIIIGGAAISAPIEHLMKTIKMPYTVGYGMTECGPLIGYEDWYNFAMRSCGKPVDGMQVRIDSEDRYTVVGEIQVKGDNVMLGYYKNPESTAAAFTADGWLRTGDLGLLDHDNNIYIKGRSKNMILTSNGQNIYPEEVEELLNAMPHVGESIIVERSGHLVAIVAVSKEDAESMPREELNAAMKENIAALNKQLPAYCQVADFEILDGDFERTPKNSIKRFLYH